MMRGAPGLMGNFQIAYGTPYWTSRGAAIGSLVRRPLSGLGFDWGTFSDVLNTGTKDFSQIYSTIQPVPQGCVKQTGPNGQSYVSCGQPYASLGIPGAITGSAGLMPILLIGGGLLVVALLARGRG